MAEAEKKECGWCRQIWDAAPFWLKAAWVVMGVGIVFGTYFAEFKVMAKTLPEHDRRISVLEDHYAHIDQQLLDIKEFLGVPTYLRPNR